MQFRFPLWTAVFVFAALGALRAQTPSGGAPAPATATSMQEGQIFAKKVVGKVSVELNGVTADLHDDDRVSQSAKVITDKDSSVILIFSNGATTQLGAETTLVIEEFMQDPFAQQIDVGALTQEPTTSHTKLNLTHGELVGKVAHLKHDQGSYFSVQTPVGAAGIRGTTFRIVFRPTGTGQAFAVFSLSTLEGNVNFQQGGGAQPPTPAPGQVPPAPGGVPVATGQEVVVTVTVNVDPKTNAVTVTAPPTITSTQPLSIETQAAITKVAQDLATTAANTTIAPATSGGSTTPSTTTSTSSTDDKKDAKKDDKGGTSGGDTSGSSSSSTASTSASSTSSGSTTPTSSGTPTASTGGGSKPSTPPPPPSPPVTTNLPVLTPGAGG